MVEGKNMPLLFLFRLHNVKNTCTVTGILWQNYDFEGLNLCHTDTTAHLSSKEDVNLYRHFPGLSLK